MENPSGLGVFKFDLRFPGMVADSETGLFQNGFRDYDSALGRYLQPDPIGTTLYKDLASKNLASAMGSVPADVKAQLFSDTPKYNQPYLYVNANPLSNVDPLGLLTASCVANNTSGSGYVNGRKVCSYTCTSGGKSVVVQGGCNRVGDGDVCYAVPVQTTSSPWGQLVDVPGTPQSFGVDTNGLWDKYIKYDSNLTNNLERAFGQK